MSEGSISLSDINEMPLKDRDFYYERLLDIKKQEQERLKEIKSKHSKK